MIQSFAVENPYTVDTSAHQSDNNDGDSSGHADEQGYQHCKNCCHGHISCLSTSSNLIAHSEMSRPMAHLQPSFQYLSLAPPTPPPNA